MLMRFAEKFVSGFFAEDIVHDVFLKLWDKQVFRLPENDLKRVLYVSVRNACLDCLRRMNMEQEIIDHRALQLKLEELDFFEASDELFMRKDLLDLLMKKVAELPYVLSRRSESGRNSRTFGSLCPYGREPALSFPPLSA